MMMKTNDDDDDDDMDDDDDDNSDDDDDNDDDDDVDAGTNSGESQSAQVLPPQTVQYQGEEGGPCGRLLPVQSQ